MTYDPDYNLYTAEPKLLSIACFPTFFPAPISPPNYERIMSNASYYHVPERRLMSSSVCSEPADLDEGLLLLDPLGNESESGDDKASGHKFTCYPTIILRLIAILVFSPAFVIYIASGSLLATIFVGFAIGRNILVISHWILCCYINIRVELKKRDRSTRDIGKLARTCPTWLKPSLFYVILDLAVIVSLIINISIDIQVFTGFCLALIAVYVATYFTKFTC